jgi:FAD/FMN-containing dehydrogenase
MSRSVREIRNLMSGLDVARLDGSVSSISEEELSAFAVDFHGFVVRPDEPGYDDARLIWNGMMNKRPGLVLRCLGTAGIAAALRFARKHDLLFAVRSGGHSMAGRSVIDDGLLIDLSLIRGVRVDPSDNHVYVQAGARLADLDKEGQAYGVAVSSGVVGTTGVAGLTLGGGTGWQMRNRGLTIDNLLSVEIVTADGDVLIANETEHDDLFWAVRGGGGNFGIVSTFEFQGYPLGPDVLVCAPWYPASMGAELVEVWRDFMATAPNEWGGQFLYWSIPPTPAFPAELHGTPAVAPFFVYTGADLDSAERIIQPMREFGEPLVDKSERVAWTRLQTQYDAMVPAQAQKYYFKSVYIDRFDDDFVELLNRVAEEFPTAMSHTLVIAFGGKMAEPGPDETAFGRRDMPFMVELDAIWTDPADEERSIAWVRRGCANAEAFSNGGGYINVSGLGEEGHELVRSSVGAANYERLARIKAKYDPNNVFRVNHNVRPAVVGR